MLINRNSIDLRSPFEEELRIEQNDLKQMSMHGHQNSEINQSVPFNSGFKD
jgi:hypothetical protein